MIDISPFIRNHLLEPLKNYPTVIQDTMIDIITQRLQELYDLTVEFPEILSPNQDRLDIIESIAEQFLFAVREEADIKEQIDILENILYVYRRRGSVDTIENMWKYYGGDLPRELKISAPFNKVFKYNISKLSGIDAFMTGASPYVSIDTLAPRDISAGVYVYEEGSTRVRMTTGIIEGSNRVHLTTVDGLSVGAKISIGDIYEGTIQGVYDTPITSPVRPGVYEINLTNNVYPIPDLREFLIKELVAAGTYIYFTNSIHMDITESGNPSYYKYLVKEEKIDNFLEIQLEVPSSPQGVRWSKSLVMSGYSSPIRGYDGKGNPLYKPDLDRLMKGGYLSGNQEIFMELTNMIDLDSVLINTYKSYLDLGMNIAITKLGDIEYTEDGDLLASITSVDRTYDWRISSTILYDIQPEIMYCTSRNSPISIESDLSNSPGYFILGKSLLGEEVI